MKFAQKRVEKRNPHVVTPSIYWLQLNCCYVAQPLVAVHASRALPGRVSRCGALQTQEGRGPSTRENQSCLMGTMLTCGM
ncbi:hypothetical protein P7K49_014725 [Saguinus oedipus]|uniref:Uncharacterized protein n=1 Tax=Saguinus oedipus TaxID=9490 RepID=A0ABQ9V7I4_SAGOE|nr:hypothetical protein P7K49_014725 [Saguinus oedipus]